MTFTTGAVGLPVDSTVIITFPSTVTVDATEIASGGGVSVAGVTGSHVASAAGQVVSVVISGSTAVDPYTVVSIKVPTGLQNGYVGGTGTYQIQTVATESGLYMEEDLLVAENEIEVGPLGVTSVAVADSRAGEVTSVTFELTLSSVLNKDAVDGGFLEIVLPDGFYWATTPVILSQASTPDPKS